MHKRVMPWLVLIAGLSMGAEYRTPNFVVIAANTQVAQQIGQWAEHYRKEKAILWLGREMPAWSQPCPLRVTVSMDGPSGATTFTFGHYGVSNQHMQIQGPLDRLIHSVLPHEVTHTVFAHHFKSAVPRWADEGGSVFSEDEPERDRHDKQVRSILNQRQQIPMRALLSLKEYPSQVMCLYAQGFSICDFLVKRSNRQHFLNFVGAGMHYGWDSAVKSYYGHNSVEELEQAWLQHLRDTKKQSAAQFAANTTAATSPIPGNAQAIAQPTSNFLGSPTEKTVRMTAPPVQPLDPPAIIRGAMPATPSAGSWQPNVRLENPVPLTPPLPRIPAYVPDDIRLGLPRP
ncbi:MAG: hypothetical protein HYR84_01270 [Planctomycetes bacterium]|nr:hypothetical protein [Planctomycetota bacterium]